MIEENKSRCQRICDNNSGHCFIDNNKQLECIADMIINKVFGISSIIQMTIEEPRQDRIARNLNKALDISNELVNWVKFLQLTHDLRKLASLDHGNGIHEKRKEIRYPLPDIIRKHIRMTIHFSGAGIQVQFMNFSRRGVQFKSPMPVKNGSLVECVLSTSRHVIDKEVAFTVRTKHCSGQDGAFIIGASIEEILNNQDLDFFRNVYDFIAEVITKQDNI